MLKGVAFSLFASLLFGYMYYFSTLLLPLSGTDIFGYRMIFTFPFVVLSVFMFCLLYTSPSPRDLSTSRMPSSA